MIWTDYLCEARSVNITRGGSQDGIVTSLDVGTASVRLVNAGNPLDSPNIKPNRPVRISSGERDTTTNRYSLDFDDGIVPPGVLANNVGWFTQEVVDNPSGDGKALHIFHGGSGSWTGFRSVTNVKKGDTYTVNFKMYVDNPNQRYGGVRISDQSVVDHMDYDIVYETASTAIAVPQGEWVDQTLTYVADRDMAKMGFYFMGTRPESMYSWNFYLDDLRLDLTRSEPQLLFTGDIQDVFMDYDREGNEFVSFTAADGIRSVNNTQRYGAVVENGAGFETWAQRMRRLSQSASTATNPPTDEGQNRIVYKWGAFYNIGDGWTTFGTKPPAVDTTSIAGYGEGPGWFTRKKTGVTSVTQTAYAYGLQRILTGLVPGRKYRVELAGRAHQTNIPSGATEYAVGIVGMSWSDPVTLNTANKTITFPPYEFVATSDTHTLRVALAENISWSAGSPQYFIEAIYFTGPTVTEYLDETIVLQDVAYESTLANHFNVASNSVGAVWWADKKNIIQFKRALDADEPVANFSDEHMPTEPEAVLLSTRVNLNENPQPTTNDWLMQTGGGLEAVTGSIINDGPLENAPTSRRRTITTAMGSAGTTGTYRDAVSVASALDTNVGNTWTASIYVRCSQTARVRLALKGFVTGSGFVTIGNGSPVTLVADTWTRLSVTATSSVATISTIPYVQVDNGDVLAVGSTLDASAVLVESGSTLGDFFDGSTVPTETTTNYAWSGEYNNSISTETIYSDAPYDPLHVCYTGIKGDYATANVVNDLTLANHGRDPLTGNTADVNYRKQDITSVASWGSRAATVDTSIYNSGAFAGSVDVRAKEITDEWGTPEVSISEVTFDPREAIGRVDFIDIFSRVNVTYKGNTYTCRVTKISHSIQADPEKWLTTLELRKD